MSETDTVDLIGRRSELLARVVLTRRLNVDLHLTDLEFALFDGKQLDRMISRIKKWYQRMQTTILADVGEMDSSRCRDGD